MKLADLDMLADELNDRIMAETRDICAGGWSFGTLRIQAIVARYLGMPDDVTPHERLVIEAADPRSKDQQTPVEVD